MLGDVAQRFRQHRLGERLELGRHAHPGLPLHADRHAGRRRQPLELFGQSRLGLERERGQGPFERAPEVADRLLHLDPAALALGRIQGLLGAQRQRYPEQPLEHALVNLARQIEPLAEAAVALLLTGRVARRGHQCGRLAERPQQVAFAVGELEPPAAAIGADHPIGATGRAQRRTHQCGDPEQLRVLGRHLGLDPVGHHHHPVLVQRPLGDRRVDQRRAQRPQLRERGPVGADRPHPPTARVGHEDRRPAHRGQPADRLADSVIELGGGGVGVEVGQQLDEHLERLDAGKQRWRRAHAAAITS